MSAWPVTSIRFASLGIALVATLMASQASGATSGGAVARPGGAPAGSHRYLVSLRGFGAPPVSGATGSAAVAHLPDVARVARVARVDHAVAALATRLGFETRFQYHWALQGFAAELDSTQVAALRADPQVGAISLDLPVHLTDQVVPSGVERVRAQPAAAGGPALPDLSTINVAEIDTGIRHLGTDTELNVAGGVDCADDPTTGQTNVAAWQDADADGHGSHVAGIIGARNNGSGVVGVAPGVKLWSVRVFDSLLQGSTSTVVCGLDWVALSRMAPSGHPVDVANLSLAGPRDSAGPEACTLDPRDDPDVEHVAVCGAFNAGVTLVVAAGNDSVDARYVVPAAYDQVITVSALSDFDGRPGGLGAETCEGSGRHETDDTFAHYSNHGADVDLIAPGTCIVSLNRSGTGGGTHVMSGTSMAAPHVTGAAARYIAAVYAANRTRPSPATVRSALRATASFNWNSATDPDAVPDRLLNVAGLSAAPGFVLAAFPAHVIVRAGAGPTDRTVRVALTRPGLFRNPVRITASGPPGFAVAPATRSLTGIGDAGLSTTFQVAIGANVADGDYPVRIDASSPNQPARHATVVIHVDRHAPIVGNFAAAIVGGKALGSRAAVQLTWQGHDAGGTITRYQLQRQIAAGPWLSLSTAAPMSRSVNRLVAVKTDYSFRVRAIDDSGNVGAWAVVSLRIGVRQSDQPSIVYSRPGWTTVLRSTASGGSLRTSHSPGASARVTFFGTGAAWVTPVGPGMGKAIVVVDGVGPGVTVNLYATRVGTRRIVFASRALKPGTHTLSISVKKGTVDVDAILILG